jgi:hypothetical protein
MTRMRRAFVAWSKFPVTGEVRTALKTVAVLPFRI